MTVQDWLTEIGLGQYAAAFAEHGVSFAILPQLTADDLREIGVAAVGHRRILLDAIAKIGKADDAMKGPAKPRANMAERRQVCALFVDLVGFTRLSSELDSEDVRSYLDAFFELADGAIVRNGGHVDKHIGDCVMGVFGAPVSHGDDIVRAVRTAAEIVDGVAAIAIRLGKTLEVHAGVASGEVLAARSGGAHSEYAVTGEAINLASRLCDRAAPGTVFVSDAVRRAARQHFAFESEGEAALKGFAQVQHLWRLCRAGGATEAPLRPLTGRHSEMAQLLAALGTCLTRGRGQSALIAGEAGIGKSRLVEEVARKAAQSGWLVLQGTVFDFGGDYGRSAIADIIGAALDRSPAGQDLGVPKPGRLELILGSDLAIAEKAALLDYAGLAMPENLQQVFAAMDGKARSAHVKSAASRLLSNAAVEKPLLAIAENLHWASAETLDLLGSIAETTASARLFLIATSRTVEKSLPHPGPQITLSLAPLTLEEAMELARSGLVADVDRKAEACVKRAGGNPLFLVQLLEHIANAGPETIPDSIQSILQARMDQLPEADRHALFCASVLGQSFALTDLRKLAGDEAYEAEGLLRQQLVRRHDAGLIFTHALIRDAAYAILPRKRRRELHRKAAGLFEDADAMLAAEHLILGSAPEAAAATIAAARDLIARFRYAEAAQIVDRVMALPASDAERAALMLLKGDALLQSSKAELSLETFDGALRIAASPRDICAARLGMASAQRILDRIEQALENVSLALEMTGDGALAEERARAFSLRGNLYFPLGKTEKSIESHEMALRLARQGGFTDIEVSALSGLGDAEYMRGNIVTSSRHYHECVALSTAHGLRRSAVANQAMVAVSLSLLGQIREGLERAIAAIAAAREIGHDRAEMISHHAAHICCRDLLQVDEAKTHAEKSLDLSRRLQAPRFEAESLAFIALADADMSNREAARRGLAEAWSITERTGRTYIGPVILGGLARVAPDAQTRSNAVAKAESLLASGSLLHNHLLFRKEMVEISIGLGDWEGVRHHALELERASLEPSQRTRFLAAYGSAIARFGEEGQGRSPELRRLMDEAQLIGDMRSYRTIKNLVGEDPA